MADRVKLFSSQRGATIAEIVVVLFCLSLLLAAAVPNIAKLKSSLDRAESRNLLSVWLYRARSEAISKGGRAIVAFSKDGRNVTLGLDPFPFNMPPLEDQNFYLGVFPKTVTVSGLEKILFDARGYQINEEGFVDTTTLALEQKGNTFCKATISGLGLVTYYCD